jgi:hypothetical protein
LAANLALVAYTGTRYTSGTANTSAARSSSSGTTTSAASAPSASLPASGAPSPAETAAPFARADTALAKILDGQDLAAMRTALEAAGLTADDAKTLIRNRIRERQKPARDLIDQRRNPDEETWWYRDDQARNTFETQRREERNALNEELTQTLASLFGPEPEKSPEEKLHKQAEFLPASKRLAVSRLLEDYEAMEREARPRGYSGAELPSDTEKRRYIAEERSKDLAALLSPEELRDYDLRYSQTAQNIRWQLSGMKPTLEEYAAIYDARAAVEQDFDTSAGSERADDFWKKRREAEAAATAKLRETLGEDRFIDYALSNDHASRQISAATERYGLPADTARKLWKLRQESGREGESIYKDKNLSRDEKVALLADLARQSRETLGRHLTPEALAELKDNNFVTWIGRLEKNHITVYNDLGNGSSGYGL